MKYKWRREHKDRDIADIQRQIADRFISVDNDGNIRIDTDIYCRDLIVSDNSVYIGSKKPENKLHSLRTELYWNDEKIVDSSTGIAPHETRHRASGLDALSHDDLSDFVANEHIDWTNTSNNIVTTGTIYGKGYRKNIVAKTAAYTATTSDDVITCGAGNETFTIDLPAVTAGKIYYIKNVGTGVITVDANTTGSTTIDGDNTQPVNQYECLKVIADASAYWSI